MRIVSLLTATNKYCPKKLSFIYDTIAQQHRRPRPHPPDVTPWVVVPSSFRWTDYKAIARHIPCCWSQQPEVDSLHCPHTHAAHTHWVPPLSQRQGRVPDQAPIHIQGESLTLLPALHNHVSYTPMSVGGLWIRHTSRWECSCATGVDYPWVQPFAKTSHTPATAAGAPQAPQGRHGMHIGKVVIFRVVLGYL